MVMDRAELKEFMQSLEEGSRVSAPGSSHLPVRGRLIDSEGRRRPHPSKVCHRLIPNPGRRCRPAGALDRGRPAGEWRGRLASARRAKRTHRPGMARGPITGRHQTMRGGRSPPAFLLPISVSCILATVVSFSEHGRARLPGLRPQMLSKIPGWENRRSYVGATQGGQSWQSKLSLFGWLLARSPAG
jgi:hypothetical protein